MDRKELSKLVTDTLFNYDPYNGLFYDEMLTQVKKDLKTVSGCYLAINGLCDIINELLEAQ